MSTPGDGFGAGDFAEMGNFDFAKMGEALSRLGRVISANANGAGLSPETVREMVTLSDDPSPTAIEIAAGLEALAVAQLWLAPKSNFTAPTPPGQVWSRTQWIDATLDGWCQVVAPLAESLSEAVSGALSGFTTNAFGDGFDASSENESSKNLAATDPTAGNPMAGIFNQMNQAMRAFGGVIFATQLGETIKASANTVTGGADIGMPLFLFSNIRPVLIPSNCRSWGAELGIPEAELRYYLALREVAGVRLFANVPWLRDYLISAIKSYSAGIKVNLEKMQEGVSGISGIGRSPEALNEAITNGLFTAEETPTQKNALLKLESIAALIEGWIDEVSASAALEHLPALPALRESARRGRATGGPLQKAFATLIGLEISPRASRDAATFFNYIATNEGIEQRDELWSAPDLLPTLVELTDPTAFRKGRSAPDDLSTL